MTDARRWGVFNLVGLLGFSLQLVVLSLLTRIWDWPYLAAAAVGVEAAIVHNYFAHTRWTWRDRPALTARERMARPVRYQCAKTLTLAVNVALTLAFVSGAGLAPEAASAAAVAVCSVLNYAISDRLIFRTA